MFRIGQSTDIHQLKEGRNLVLGGVMIPHDKGCLGHSDGDALYHAVAESILGAFALGDLGKHFPDADEKNRNMDSSKIMEYVYEIMNERDYEIQNLDALILIEKPKMAPWINQMRENIAQYLHCDKDHISVKATRGETLGFVGREEGVMVQAIVLLKKIMDR